MAGNYLRQARREQLHAERTRAAEERDEQASCAGKHPYTTFREASRIASYGAHEAGRRLRAYKCSLCNQYHIGASARHYPPDILYHQRRLKTMDELLDEGQDEVGEVEADEQDAA